MEASDLFERAREHRFLRSPRTQQRVVARFRPAHALPGGKFCVRGNFQNPHNRILAWGMAGEDLPTACFSVCPLIPRICG